MKSPTTGIVLFATVVAGGVLLARPARAATTDCGNKYCSGVTICMFRAGQDCAITFENGQPVSCTTTYCGKT